MTRRQLPFIKNEPNNFQNLIDEALKLRLYELTEICIILTKGPTVFEFKTQSQLKTRVEIGQFLSCSACNKREQCVHTIYLLHKIFKRSLVPIHTRTTTSCCGRTVTRPRS